ncbi:site-specific DNA-methyltransferase [Saprospiraceae bacterium]|nr:site-specific DNA-methyltransferase [Saprospiraceae bacterium]
MQNLLNDLKALLAQDERFIVEGKLLKNQVVESALQLDPKLIKLLLQSDTIKQHFFQDVEGVLVFDKVKFQKFVSNKEFLPDSYTAFKNKIGLTADREFLTDSKEVVLSWAYKDCVLEGGQDKEDAKRKEIFWNETLAPNDIDRLLYPKVFTNWKRYTKKGEEEVKEVSLKDNLIIKGNNLLALHSLKKVYRGEVKLIYIDPPYNTGKDSFGYNDSFTHSAWLVFMKNRLVVAKELLSREGVLFISIDDKEHAYLKVLCDEIFGRENFIGDLVWETATDNNPSQIAKQHEYIIIYVKDKTNQGVWTGSNQEAEILLEAYHKIKKKHKDDLEKIQSELRNFIKSNKSKVYSVKHYDNVDEKGVFHDGDVANTKFGGYDYEVIHPVTKKTCKIPEKGFRFKWDTMKKMIDDGDIMFGEDETTLIKPKKRLEDAKDYLRSVMYEDGRASTKELERMFYKDFL